MEEAHGHDHQHKHRHENEHEHEHEHVHVEKKWFENEGTRALLHFLILQNALQRNMFTTQLNSKLEEFPEMHMDLVSMFTYHTMIV